MGERAGATCTTHLEHISWNSGESRDVQSVTCWSCTSNQLVPAAPTRHAHVSHGMGGAAHPVRRTRR